MRARRPLAACRAVLCAAPWPDPARDGQTYDYKMMLAEHVRQRATPDDLEILVELPMKARNCMNLD